MLIDSTPLDPLVLILREAAQRGRELRRQREAQQAENVRRDDAQAQPDQQHDENEAARA